MKKRILTLLVASVMLLTLVLAGCGKQTQAGPSKETGTPGSQPGASGSPETGSPTDGAGNTAAPSDGTDDPADSTPGTRPDVAGLYTGAYSEKDGTYGGIDDLGRVLGMDGDVSAPRDRKVGIFYFLWQGQEGTAGPYDNSEIIKKDPTATESQNNWLRAGGGALGAHHFWGKPLFGYYKSSDSWVMRKHVQMLTDAGVDFIAFDATNAKAYLPQVAELISVWYEYMEMGYNVPKLTFLTNSSSGKTMQSIYKSIYMSASLHKKYPNLDNLWYQWDGKPMIVGDASDPELSSEAKEYFRIKANVWPNAARKDDGFPWMEFGRLYTDDAVYGLNGRKEVVNVSIAQHNVSGVMSDAAWYGAQDHTRSWHDGANDTAADAVLYGYNFAEQWEWAISVDPEMIFITGWNEWVAQRQDPARIRAAGPIIFVDCASPNASRDAEPMDGLFGDNYYMQMIYYIRKYKGTAPRVRMGNYVSIDVDGSFDQWNDSAITAQYSDYAHDTEDRNERGFGTLQYTNTTGRNDFTVVKAARDARNLYFYAQTADAITTSGDENWMTLFLSSGVAGNAKWANQFDYAVNLEKPNGNEVVISQYNADGTWTRAGTGRMKVEGNQIMICIPRETVGLPDNSGQTILDVQFKWADNYQRTDGKLNVFSFYTDGDAAPYGRLTYVFSEKG